MSDLLLAAFLAVMGWWLLSANNPEAASAGQFAVGCLAVIIAAGFVWNWAMERQQ